MKSESDKAIEAGARAIARHIPLDAGSRWNPGYGENFPAGYTEAECKIIRAISEMCITAALASGSLVPAEQLAAINSIPPNLNWLIGKGRTRPDEPLYGVQMLDPESGIDVGHAEHDDLSEAIKLAVAAATSKTGSGS